MKNLKTILLAIFATICLCACKSELRDEAKETPIGSVFSGETTSSGDYFKKVSEQNKSATSSPWQPKSDGRF